MELLFILFQRNVWYSNVQRKIFLLNADDFIRVPILAKFLNNRGE